MACFLFEGVCLFVHSCFLSSFPQLQPHFSLSSQVCVLSLFLFAFVPPVSQIPKIVKLMVGKEH